jgi:hypothetical protein
MSSLFVPIPMPDVDTWTVTYGSALVRRDGIERTVHLRASDATVPFSLTSPPVSVENGAGVLLEADVELRRGRLVLYAGDVGLSPNSVAIDITYPTRAYVSAILERASSSSSCRASATLMAQ